MRRTALVAALLLAAAALAGVARPDGARALDGKQSPSDVVTVAGTGSVDVTPSTAVFSFGVDTRAATARAALAANARTMRDVIAALRAAGASGVTTQAVSVGRAFDQSGRPSGFAASNAVAATTRIDRAGAVLDAAVDAGANRVEGPSVASADQAAAYRKALTEAMADARLRAETLAAAAGRTLGPVTSIAESGSDAPVPFADKLAATDGGTPVEAGVQEVTAGVTVTFTLP